MKILQAVRVGDDRAVASDLNSLFNRFPPGNVDYLSDEFHIDPLAPEFVLVRVLGVDLFNVQVGDIRAKIGKSPGKTGIVPGDDSRRPGEGETNHIESTVIADWGAMQPVQVPDRGHLCVKMHVIG